ncbi:hypothetical protein F511_21659 [Dorcoceras hygrometricum]|uniref:HAT C-terminal dimerisation domain-containing protein n=1 Tax=Dorcoceras hygrometricum TaxID=472368 RepID=A0A2Z7B6K7_9LAMI|nr:hypothetical protein F511_21659 [Dorcoceras hygrometricum]
MGQGSALVPHIFSQKRCELKLTRYVVIDEVSFRAIEGNGFVGLLHELQPKFRIPDQKKISGLVYDLFLEESEDTKSRLNKFREFAVLAKFSITSTVPMDVKTRWNATYKMLEVALKYRRVFERMAEEWFPFINYFHEADEKGKKRLGPPVADDWENAKAFVHFLKKFYDATLELSASKSPTSQLIYQSLIALEVEIERKRLDDSDPTLKKVAHAMKLKFDKYWGNWDNMNPSIFIANVLDPRNKLQMIKVSIKKFGGTATMIQEFVNKVKLELVNLWMEYKGINDMLYIESQSMQLERDGGGSGMSSAGGGLCDELFDDVDAQNEEEQLLEISNEVDKYLADEIEKRSNQYFNLLEWWKGNETRYPIISMIAKDIFAIPSSTVASEAAFSLGKRVVDPFRSCLSPKMVEALVCTSDWLRAEEFSIWKDPTDDDLELYEEIEEIEKSKSIFYLSLNVYKFC